MIEIWKPIVGYEQHYQVSSQGRVRRIATGRVLKFIGVRYPVVTLHKNGDGGRAYHVHRLVWIAFCGSLAKGMEVNHKDLNKQNPRLDNLEAVTHQQNAQHAVAHGVKFGPVKVK
jgi:hypothetical protein